MRKKIEALHEITDLVHEMLSVCAPIARRARERSVAIACEGKRKDGHSLKVETDEMEP